MKTLTAKQARFVAEYPKDLNATQAAIRAGYSTRRAMQTGHENVRKREIAAAIAAQQAPVLAKLGLTSERTLEEIKRIAYSDVRRMFDGLNLKPISEMDDETAACVASFEVVIKNAAAGDGHTDTVHKLKAWDKLKALEMAAKHLGLLVERVEHSGGITILHELPE